MAAGRRRGPRGLLERRRARCSSSGSRPQPPADYRRGARDRRQAARSSRSARRAARARRPDPAAAGGALPDSRAAHTDADIDRTLEAAADAMPAVAAAARRRRRRPEGRTAMRRAALVVSMVAAAALRRRLRRRQRRRRAAAVGSGTPVNGGTLRAGIPGQPRPPRPGPLVHQRGLGDPRGDQQRPRSRSRRRPAVPAPRSCPDIATAMPTVTDGGRTYTFHVRPDVMFSAAGEPRGEAVRLQVLDRAPVPGRLRRRRRSTPASWARTATPRPARAASPASSPNDATSTITFHLTQPDGTFLDYMATPFAFVAAHRDADKDISTLAAVADRHRALRDLQATCPSSSSIMTRNPNFHSVDARHAGRPPERRSTSRSASRPSSR